VIRFDNVHKAFGENEVLRGFSLEVREGETMVIIGYSGTGKSVAIKHIVGLLEPDEGHVEVDGVTVGALTRRDLYRLRSKIGYVFQFAALFDSLTIAENVAMGLRKQGELTETQIAERVRESLRLVDLDDAVGDKLPSELSGGMRKRVGMQRQLGVTGIVITHDMRSAYTVGTRIAMLYEGRVRQVGTVEEIQQSTDPIIRQFIEGRAELESGAHVVGGVPR